MIRINLQPSKKRGAKRATSADVAERRGAIYAFALLIVWAAVGGALYVVLDNVEKETARVQAETKGVVQKIDNIKKLIDEERLAARKAELERIRAAKAKVEAQRRTPVFVMHELANIMTSGREPDYDEEEYRRCRDKDPQCALDPSWDGYAIWLDSVVENDGGLLEFRGQARDAADLSEFVKRLRVSARFSDVSHPRFAASKGRGRPQAGQTSTKEHLEFSMTARIAYWD